MCTTTESPPASAEAARYAVGRAGTAPVGAIVRLPDVGLPTRPVGVLTARRFCWPDRRVLLSVATAAAGAVQVLLDADTPLRVRR